ncbi:MAG: rRNA pseudouridine synthase [Magnetococcales bacterium]|nr:rRNA pseudouridine synthase [Magnetococcales bacterium]MBF0156630.1 rRNA pseudouridine synthase [Magnetococcales bacterium]
MAEGHGAADGVRLQKWLAGQGLCSRREGEGWILAGRVSVNGVSVTALGSRVVAGDRVTVDGKPVRSTASSPQVLVFHKPRGLVCTRKDPEGRATIFDHLERDHGGLPRLVTVGRLDLNSEGLLLLTNHGELTHALTHPSRQVARVYRVRVHGRVDPITLERLRQGVELEDGPTGPLELELDAMPGANSWLTVTLREGRNRIVRRLFERFQMEVSRLVRIAYGPVTLGALERGSLRQVTPKEWQGLMSVAGLVEEGEKGRTPERPPARREARARKSPGRGG